MIKHIWRIIGVAGFFIILPGLIVVTRFTLRTRVVAVSGGSVLLVRPWLGRGKWILPGGGLHRNEHHANGAARELVEETGVKVEPADMNYFGKAEHRQMAVRFWYDRFWIELPEQVKPRPQFIEVMDVEWVPLVSLGEYQIDQDALDCINAWQEIIAKSQKANK
jgi:8-oxo-dGTP diphosphatase